MPGGRMSLRCMRKRRNCNNKNDKTLTVERRDIKISDAIDNNWIVESGLKDTDSIVVSGIQQVKSAGQKVTAISQKEYEKKQSKAAGK